MSKVTLKPPTRRELSEQLGFNQKKGSKMSKGKGIPVEDTIPPAPVAPKPTQQEFIDAYQKLCKSMGWTIVGQPVLKQMNDLGGSMITIQLSIVQYEEPSR